MSNYFRQIWHFSRTILIGMMITIRYFLKPKTVTTVQYPHELDPIPDRHRGIHHLELSKCIMCDLCAKACPVDCITIIGTRSGEFDGASAGSGSWMSEFSIDYGECLFCNLCIEACPKDCIHMKPKHLLDTRPAGYDPGKYVEYRKEYDFSTFRREDLVKNLLADCTYTEADRQYALVSRPRIEAVEERAKLEKAEAARKKKEEAGQKKPARDDEGKEGT